MSQIGVVDEAAGEGGSNWLPRFLRPPTPAPPITDPALIERSFTLHRRRILFWCTFGYAIFYFVRRNFDVVMPVIGKHLGISTSMLGLILTIQGVVYGISKFLNGILADRSNARIFMASALIICSLVNVCFGLSSSIIAFGFLWMINGWFQGMGFPPCARLLTHWFAPRELATKLSIWNISHSLGAGLIAVLCGLIVKWADNRHGRWEAIDWRLCFFIPACIGLATGFLLLKYLRDTPESVGLPEVEGTAATTQLEANAGKSTAKFKVFLRHKVFANKYIWIASIANFFVYTIRFGFYSWGTTVLVDFKGFRLFGSTAIVFGFELAGICGMLLTGWMTDRFFRGRAAPLAMMSMLGCAVTLFLFWKAPRGHFWLNLIPFICVGFFIYGPQALVAVIVVHLATKRGAATAVGLTSIFGYASTVLSGWGIGALVQHYGWNGAYPALIGVALVGAFLFALALPAKSHGQLA